MYLESSRYGRGRERHVDRVHQRVPDGRGPSVCQHAVGRTPGAVQATATRTERGRNVSSRAADHLPRVVDAS